MLRQIFTSSLASVHRALYPQQITNYVSSQLLRRSYATIDDLKGEVDNLNDKFAEARDEIEMAREDEGTTYFAEGYDMAKKATDDCLEMWTGILDKLEEAERSKLQRSMGMKMEQLKAEFGILQKILEDDH